VSVFEIMLAIGGKFFNSSGQNVPHTFLTATWFVPTDACFPVMVKAKGGKWVERGF
jgi:hypothetical protein